jgi:hypothetical protein
MALGDESLRREEYFQRYRYQPWTLRAALHTIALRLRMHRKNPHV